MKERLNNEKAGLKTAGAAKVSSPADETGARRGLLSSIPLPDEEFVPWLGIFPPFLTANAGKGNYSAAKAAKTQGHADVYIASVTACAGGNKSPLLLARKNEAKAVIYADCVGFISFELRNPVFSDADLLEGGVKVAKKTYERDKKIVDVPANEFQGRTCNEVSVITYCSGTDDFSIPKKKGCRGLEGRGVILESSASPVPLAKDCPIVVTSTRHKFTIKFPEGSSGKYFTLYLRYTNNFPEPGSWSSPSGTTIL